MFISLAFLLNFWESRSYCLTFCFQEEEEMEILDVTTIEAPDYLQSSDEEELEDFSTDLENGKSLWFVPVVPEIDLVEEGNF